jgi:enamine deaminase RidA (YjgF/YER057c/UK114 family)
MLTRRYVWPKGHWSWPIKVSHKHGLRCGEFLFAGGQVDLDAKGSVRHAGDLPAQTRAAAGHVRTVIEALGGDLEDLVKLVVYYVARGDADEAAMLAVLRGALGPSPMPVLSTVPVPYLAYPGLMVEIDAIAMRGPDGRRIAKRVAEPAGHWTWPAKAGFAQGLRCGRMIYVGGQRPLDGGSRVVPRGDIVGQSHRAMENVGAVLAALGAGFDDAVKFNAYYVGQGTAADWEAAARARASYFTEPGPAATGIPLPEILPDGTLFQIEVWAMLAEDGTRLPRRHSWPQGHWDWPIHLPYKHGLRCGEMMFLGGQVALTPEAEVLHRRDTAAQTRIAMANIARVLALLDAGIDDVVKVNAFYEGDGTYDNLHENLAVRSAAFREPGPVTTGIPLPCLAYRDMMIEIDTIAMKA